MSPTTFSSLHNASKRRTSGASHLAYNQNCSRPRTVAPEASGSDLVLAFFERFENLDAGHSIGVGVIAMGPRQSCGASTQGRNPRQEAQPARALQKFRRPTISVMRIFLARSICSWVLKG